MVNRVLLVFAIALPPAVWLLLPGIPSVGKTLPVTGERTSYKPSPVGFEQQPLGAADVPPWTTNTQLVDLNRDGHLDVLVCDARWNRVVVFQQVAVGRWKEDVLATDLVAPAHATVVDFDGDQDLDVIVSVLGNIWPDDSVVGRLVALEQTPGGFQKRELLANVRRVADAQPGDFDNDGDLDLAVAVFGYARGEVLWLENHGEWTMEPHSLLLAAGTIHVPVADYDGDGDLDIAATVSQDDEEVWAFENRGAGTFEPKRLWMSLNHDLGSAGLIQADLDADGDADLILPVGDNLEDAHSYPQEYHGCLWLENQGNWKFSPRRIASLGGTYAAATGDVDGDGDLDVVLASLINGWAAPTHASLVWLENRQSDTFPTWRIAGKPTQLVTVGCGDVNGDGRADIVAGGLSVAPPYESGPPALLWISQPEARP